MRPIQSGSTYHIRAKCDLGDFALAAWSTTVAVKMPQLVPPQIEQVIIVPDVVPLQIRIDWSSSVPYECKLAAYELDLLVGSDEWKHLGWPIEEHFTLTDGVFAGGKYVFRVRAVADTFGPSQWSKATDELRVPSLASPIPLEQQPLLPTFSKKDVNRTLTMRGGAVTIGGDSRAADWTEGEPADVLGDTIIDVEEGYRGIVQLQGGVTLKNPQAAHSTISLSSTVLLLQWDSVPSELPITHYEVELQDKDRHGFFRRLNANTTVVRVENLVDSNFVGGALDAEVRYTWRVRAISAESGGPIIASPYSVMADAKTPKPISLGDVSLLKILPTMKVPLPVVVKPLAAISSVAFSIGWETTPGRNELSKDLQVEMKISFVANPPARISQDAPTVDQDTDEPSGSEEESIRSLPVSAVKEVYGRAPGATYEVALRAISKNERVSGWSAKQVITMPLVLQPEAPQLESTPGTSNKLATTWKVPTIVPPSKDGLLQYELRLSADGGKSVVDTYTQPLLDPEKLHMPLQGLAPATEYCICVRAATLISNWSAWSSWSSAISLDGFQHPPQGVKAATRTGSSILIEWDPANCIGGQVSAYDIEAYRNGELHGDPLTAHAKERHDTVATVLQLPPGEYTFRVRGRATATQLGPDLLSNWSHPTHPVKLAPGPPLPAWLPARDWSGVILSESTTWMQRIELSVISSTSFRVQWSSAPVRGAGAVERYEVSVFDVAGQLVRSIDARAALAADVEGLLPARSYSVNVCAVTADGITNDSGESTRVVLPGVHPPARPLLQQQGSTSVVVRWCAPLFGCGSSIDCKLLAYQLQVSYDGGKTFTERFDHVVEPNDKEVRSYSKLLQLERVRRLGVSAVCVCRVRAEASVIGVSEWSQLSAPVTLAPDLGGLATAPSVSQAAAPKVRPISRTAVEVWWEPAAASGCEVASYEVSYEADGGKRVAFARTSLAQVVLLDLSVGRTYQFYVLPEAPIQTQASPASDAVRLEPSLLRGPRDARLLQHVTDLDQKPMIPDALGGGAMQKLQPPELIPLRMSSGSCCAIQWRPGKMIGCELSHWELVCETALTEVSESMTVCAYREAHARGKLAG